MMISDCPDTYVSRSPRRRATLRAAAAIGDLSSAATPTHCNDGFGNEIQSAFDLTMPETPSDPLDRLGEASTSVAISLRGVGPACGRLVDVLNPHLEMEPVLYMMGRTWAGGFAELSWTICTIAQIGFWGR